MKTSAHGGRKMARFRGVSHVGIAARDPGSLAAFYKDVMGMQVTGGSGAGDGQFGSSLFLSSRPDDENHEIVFFADPRYAHTAFRVDSLEELRGHYRHVLDRGVKIEMALNHGCSLAFYFRDPEGNMIEVYWATNIHNWQPYGDPIDPAAAAEELLADVERVARETAARRVPVAP